MKRKIRHVVYMAQKDQTSEGLRDHIAFLQGILDSVPQECQDSVTIKICPFTDDYGNGIRMSIHYETEIIT